MSAAFIVSGCGAEDTVASPDMGAWPPPPPDGYVWPDEGSQASDSLPPPDSRPPDPEIKCESGKPCTVLLVDQQRYPSIRDHLLRFVDDVRGRFAVSFSLEARESYETWPPEKIRALLQARYTSYQIFGTILIGRMPYARWEHDWDGGNKGVNSFFYEDLDGTWDDTDGNGLYDFHDWGANPGPEIFVSWLYPSANDTAGDLKAFFDKTHAYYLGQLSKVRKRGLVMIHSDWARDMDDFQDYFGQLEGLYGAANVDRRGGYNASGQPIQVDGNEYLQLIQLGYETTIFYTHANASGHYPDLNPVTREEVAATAGGSLITFIGGCHSGDFVEAGTQLALAATYVFKTPIGLAATGTTWSYGPEELAQVTSRLGQGMSLGEAWLAKQKYRNNPTHYEEAYGHEPAFDHHEHMYGEIFFGNPFIEIK